MPSQSNLRTFSIPVTLSSTEDISSLMKAIRLQLRTLGVIHYDEVALLRIKQNHSKLRSVSYTAS